MKDQKVLFIIVSALILIWALSGIIIITSINDWSHRGALGDLFGVINSLFSGLALAGLIYTIYQSKKDLLLQREEIEINRKELIKSRKIQEKSEKALEEQVRQLKLSAKLNGLKTLIDYFNIQINNPNNSEEIILKARLKRREAIAEIDGLIERFEDDDLDDSDPIN
jgi:hypothetical protein